MNLITLENISKSYSEKQIINNISFGINEGEKIGIIGVNGTGKSTLLKIVAGLDEFYEGKITKVNKLRCEYLPQNVNFNDEDKVLTAVFYGDTVEMKALREYEDIVSKLSSGQGDYEELSNKLIEAQEPMDDLNLWDMEREAKTILTKLGITNFEEKVSNLSGGQRKRIALASALIRPCDLLILDEPTNHLDSETIGWLEEYLNSRKGSLLMITHDRYFLDRVTNRIIELDKGNLYSYDGNYSYFLEKKIERKELEKSSEEKRQNFLRNELKWVKRGAKARSTKQKARLDRFKEISEIKYDGEDQEVDFDIKGSRLGKKLVEINNVSKSFGDKEIIKDFSYILLRKDRIGIIGENGRGKSTLMNLIAGELPVDSGEIIRGETVKIGYFSQENYFIDNDLRVIDYIREVGEYLETASGEKITASAMLEKFLFTPEIQYTEVKRLSGGEKRRLYLLRVLMSAPNILLLDEPTNDLDITTLTILEDYLDSFDGPVITVSHDRYFIDRICNKIFYFKSADEIDILHGGYNEYLLFRQLEEEKVLEVKEKKEKPKSEKALKFSFNEQREYETIDEVIENLEEKIKELDKSIEENASSYGTLNDLLKEKEQVEKELSEKYDRWTYLYELAEKIEQSKK